MFGGIGDAQSDRVPLQVGQFESDNRMDDQLRTIFLEGNGGGQKSESYELATYFIARHTVTDAWEKRGRKGVKRTLLWNRENHFPHAIGPAPEPGNETGANH